MIKKVKIITGVSVVGVLIAGVLIFGIIKATAPTNRGSHPNSFVVNKISEFTYNNYIWIYYTKDNGIPDSIFKSKSFNATGKLDLKYTKVSTEKPDTNAEFNFNLNNLHFNEQKSPLVIYSQKLISS